MASQLFELKRGDTAPAFEATVTDNGAPVDFTGATVKVIGTRDRTPVFSRAATTATSGGKVTMNWQPGDTAVAGLMSVEIESTAPDGTITTYPRRGVIYVLVSPDLGGTTIIPDPPIPPTGTTITYNPDGSVATVTENGVLTSYTYNGDGTVHTDTTQGVTRTYSYDTNGNLTAVTVTP